MALGFEKTAGTCHLRGIQITSLIIAAFGIAVLGCGGGVAGGADKIANDECSNKREDNEVESDKCTCDQEKIKYTCSSTTPSPPPFSWNNPRPPPPPPSPPPRNSEEVGFWAGTKCKSDCTGYCYYGAYSESGGRCSSGPETCSKACTSTKQKGAMKDIATVVGGFGGPAIGLGVVAVLLGIGGVFGAGSLNKSCVCAWTIIGSLLVIAFVSIAVWSIFVGGLLGVFCAAIGYTGNPEGEPECAKIMASFYNSVLTHGCDAVKEIKKDELWCKYAESGSWKGKNIFTCSCSCEGALDGLCNNLATSISIAGVFLFLTAIVMFTGAIFGCCVSCCNKEKEVLEGTPAGSTATPVATATAVL